jgi:hypothetical protein
MGSEHLAPRAPALPQTPPRRARFDAADDQAAIRRWLLGAAALSLIAALIHAWMGPEHFAEWWGYGLFFLGTAIFQAGYAVDLIREPRADRLWLGIVVNLGIIVLWAWTRTVGIPLVGPHAGDVEPVGLVDVVSKLSEAGVVVLLLVVLRHPAMAAPAATNRRPRAANLVRPEDDEQGQEPSFEAASSN